MQFVPKCAWVRLPSVIPPASEKLLGVCDLSLIRKGWEDLLGDKSWSKRQLLSRPAVWITQWKVAAEFLTAVEAEGLLLSYKHTNSCPFLWEVVLLCVFEAFPSKLCWHEFRWSNKLHTYNCLHLNLQLNGCQSYTLHGYIFFPNMLNVKRPLSSPFWLAGRWRSCSVTGQRLSRCLMSPKQAFKHLLRSRALPCAVCCLHRQTVTSLFYDILGHFTAYKST